MVGHRAARKDRGYVALISVLIIGAAATAIAVALLATGVDSQRSANVTQQSRQARSLAIACSEEASQQVHDNIAFSGTNNLSLGQGTCSYTVYNSTNTTRTITATGTVGNVIKKLQATATVGASTITIGSWKEVSANVPSTPAFVQLKMNATVSSVSSLAATFNAAETAGNTNIVIVGWDSATSTINSVADASGNTYVLAAPITRGTALTQAIYYAKNVAAATPTVTVTFSAAVTAPDIRLVEYSGVDAVNPFDTSASNIGAVTPGDSGTLNTTYAKGIIVSGGQGQNSYSTAGSGYTLRGVSTNGNIVEDRAVTTTGAYTGTAPVTGNWVQQAVALRAAGQ